MQPRQIFLRHLAQTSTAPMGLEISRAEGVYLYDTQGKAYLDLISGIGVSCLGHGHPAVRAALHRQTDLHLHTLVYGEFVLNPQVQLAALLTQQLAPSLNAVYLVNSGAEATEGAMKLAKRATGRRAFVACRNAYHGSTQGALSLMDSTYFTAPFRPLLPDIRHIRFNCFEDLGLIDTEVAAVVIEPVQAESGVRQPATGYLQAVADRCRSVGALLIFDEAQTGFGRTGRLWGYQHSGVVPDIMLLAKGMGGGMPIGAFVASRALLHLLTHDPVLGHITTFGGHPMSAAAALATLQELTQGDLIAQVAAKERLFLDLLKHPAVIEVRSAGLWLAVELPSHQAVMQVINHCLEHGLITDWFLFNDRSLRIAPPLTITETQIAWACHVILQALDGLQ